MVLLRESQLHKKEEKGRGGMETAASPMELQKKFAAFVQELFPETPVLTIMPEEFPEALTHEHRYIMENLDDKGLLRESRPLIFYYHSITGAETRAQLFPCGRVFVVLKKPVFPLLLLTRKTSIKQMFRHVQFIHHFLVTKQEREEALKAEWSEFISQGIHDSLAQQLFFISAKTFELRMSLPAAVTKEDKTYVKLGELEEAVQRVQSDTRSYIAYLKGDHKKTELFEALENMLAKRLAPHPVTYRFHTKGRVVNEKLLVEETIYHVVEEIISNALKHGKISHVDVDLQVNAVQWELRITDDGIGLPAEIQEASNEKNYGLSGMKRRIEDVNGYISYHRIKDTGTFIECIIPRGGEGKDE
ncbi:sensor histidine kinase [Alkalicoccus halolimnae]|uniref:histidine kinase n=1 Tax=Alkalicoccus halolimnae TaxID=1667239 RepID=A0A5C7FFE1_9BACI|nr:ATP-binding protein [Alkalicoccus halolimnae]TXF84610.1 hypothetical protein FTX54_10435 [Alkalicoccus halolimnae]